MLAGDVLCSASVRFRILVSSECLPLDSSTIRLFVVRSSFNPTPLDRAY